MQRRAARTRDHLLRVLAPVTIGFSVLLAAASYTQLRQSILEDFDRKLIVTSTLIGALIDPVDHAALTAEAKRPDHDGAAIEASPAYQRNIAPMIRVREALGLTYLYTEVLGGPQDIFYVLDATPGEEHTQAGYADSLPPETLAGLRLVQAEGKTFVSPIKSHERWGLLKVSAAPIRAADGSVIAAAGADVNISIIRRATQDALFLSALVGAAALAAAAAGVWMITRRLAGPTEATRLMALRLAAGEREPSRRGTAPKEIMLLSRDLRRLARGLTGARQAREARAAERAERARTRMLAKLIARLDAQVDGMALFAPTGEPLDQALWRHGAIEALRRLDGDEARLQALMEASGGLAVIRRGDRVTAIGRGEASLRRQGVDLGSVGFGRPVMVDEGGELEVIHASERRVLDGARP